LEGASEHNVLQSALLEQQPMLSTADAARDAVDAAQSGLYIEKTYPIDISSQLYGSYCNRIALFVDQSMQDDSRTGKWQKMDYFVRHMLVPKLQNDYFITSEVITL
jgi:hypothetical protein